MDRSFAVSTALLIFVSTAIGCASSDVVADDGDPISSEEVVSRDARLAPFLAFLDDESLPLLEIQLIAVPDLRTQAAAQYRMTVRSPGGERKQLGVRIYPSEEALLDEMRRIVQAQGRARERQPSADGQRPPSRSTGRPFAGIFHSGVLLVVQHEEDRRLTAALRRSFGRQVR